MIKDYKYISRYKKAGPLGFNIIFSSSFFCVGLYRLSNWLACNYLYPLSKFFSFVNYIIFHVDIDPRATLLGGVYIPHPLSIVIGAHVRVKGNIKIMQNSTMGGNLGRSSVVNNCIIMQPLFEANAYVGIGATVLGPIHFNGNVFVGAHVLLTSGCYNDGLVLGNNVVRELSEELKQEMRLNEKCISSY